MQEFVFVVWILLVLESTLAVDVYFYVSPSGDDNNNGTSYKFPFKTVAKAVSTASYASYKDNNTIIELMAGYHELSRSLNIVRPNLVMRSYQHQEVHVVGGTRIPNTVFKSVSEAGDLTKLPAAARQHVKIVALPTVGITHYGTISSYGTFSRRTAELEIFYNGQPLQLPSWPKTGYLDITSVPDAHGLTFHYNATAPSSWHQEANPWIYGYLERSWSDRSVKVTALNTKAQTVTIDKHVTGTIVPGHWNASVVKQAAMGGFFKFVNILSALSQPGEYYVDRTHGNLYLWPPTKDSSVHSSDIVYASVVDNCIHVDSRSKNVKLQDFTIEACRRNGINAYATTGLQLINLEVKNTGSDAIYFQGDNRDCLVSKCLIHDSDGGINLNGEAYHIVSDGSLCDSTYCQHEGGNRTSLESSGNIIEHNEIYKYSRHGAVGYAGVQAGSGVGHIIRYNNIHSSRSEAIMYQGNDILIEHNLMHHVCENKYYCDCVVSSHDLTMRGNVLRSNIIHDIVGMRFSEVRALHLDDHTSGNTITNNIFYNNVVHIIITGGRDNIVSENIFYDAIRTSLQLDYRNTLSNANIQYMHRVPYNNTVWSLRYPDLAEMDKHNAALPEGNQVTKNLMFNKDGVAFFSGNAGEQFRHPNFFNITSVGISTGPIDHNDVNVGDYRVRCYASKWANKENVPQFPSPNDVGPKYEPGPSYLHRGRQHVVTLHNSHTPCTTMAPDPNPPMPAYLPDGTGTHVHYNVTNEGCWLSVSKCANHTAAVGTYRDMYGERYHNARDSEEMCLKRASEQWHYCGFNPRETVAAIYGPTGATSYGGQDCVYAQYGCPKHGGPSDGHAYDYNNGTIGPEYYSINNLNANNNESVCLSRALSIWIYCGSYRNHPVTMIYKPTGATRTAGAGCWIKTMKCPKHPETKPVFYDAWGATNRLTDKIEYTCLDQAEYYWSWCGYDPKYPVTATYRPTTKSFTYP